MEQPTVTAWSDESAEAASTPTKQSRWSKLDRTNRIATLVLAGVGGLVVVGLIFGGGVLAGSEFGADDGHRGGDSSEHRDGSGGREGDEAEGAANGGEGSVADGRDGDRSGPQSPPEAQEPANSSSGAAAPARPGQSAIANFPAAQVTAYRTIVQDTLTKVQANDQGGAKARIKDLETAWDQDQPTLQPLDGANWTLLDGQIDAVLESIRATSPDVGAETGALNQLSTSLK